MQVRSRRPTLQRDPWFEDANLPALSGLSAPRSRTGFASIAHIPALQELPDFEISAVCTTRQDSAEAAARHYGVPLAFCDAEKLAQHPDVDLVTMPAMPLARRSCSQSRP